MRFFPCCFLFKFLLLPKMEEDGGEGRGFLFLLLTSPLFWLHLYLCCFGPLMSFFQFIPSFLSISSSSSFSTFTSPIRFWPQLPKLIASRCFDLLLLPSSCMFWTSADVDSFSSTLQFLARLFHPSIHPSIHPSSSSSSGGPFPSSIRLLLLLFS